MSTVTAAETSTARGGRHPVEVGHLVMGLAFLCIIGAWALVQAGAVSIGDTRWLLPVPWLVGGAAGLGVIAVRSVRRAGATAEQYSETPGSPETGTDSTHPATDTEEIR